MPPEGAAGSALQSAEIVGRVRTNYRNVASDPLVGAAAGMYRCCSGARRARARPTPAMLALSAVPSSFPVVNERFSRAPELGFLRAAPPGGAAKGAMVMCLVMRTNQSWEQPWVSGIGW